MARSSRAGCTAGRASGRRTVRTRAAAPAARTEPAIAVGEKALELAQLVVHRHADRLEAAGCGMQPGPSASEDAADHARELARRAEGTGARDGARQRAGARLLAEGGQDAGELALGPLVHDLGGARVAAGVHAHVERGVDPEAEAARRIVELEGAHAQVEQYGVGAVPLELGEHGAELAEARLAEDDALARQALSGAREGRAIAIEPEEPRPGSSGQEGRRVAAETHGRVDETGTRPGAQPLHHLPHQHRNVSGAPRPDVRPRLHR